MMWSRLAGISPRLSENTYYHLLPLHSYTPTLATWLADYYFYFLISTRELISQYPRDSILEIIVFLVVVFLILEKVQEFSANFSSFPYTLHNIPYKNMKITPPPPPLSEFVILNSDDVVISSIREYNIKPDSKEQSLHLELDKKC